MENLFDKFTSLKGAKFIGINGYKSKTTGEISNFVINTNISVENAKQKDLDILKAITETQLSEIAKLNSLPLEMLKIALSEMIASAEKNLSENIEDRSVNSQAMTEAYFSITNGLKMLKKNCDVYVSGFEINKYIIQEGEKKSVNHNDKTLCKNAIRYFAKLHMNKYRSMIIGNANNMTITGDTITLK